jgi:cobalt-zinc-cadmium efflux system membrane fusion protein
MNLQIPPIALGVLLALCLGTTSVKADSDEVADETAASKGKPEVVSVTADQQRALGIETALAGPEPIEATVELLGEVVPNGDRLAHIVPRFAGIVYEVRKVAGDTVRAGEVLAVIESSDSLVRYELKTLIDGTVLSKHLTIGEAVSTEKQLYLVADLSSVWVDLSVYQKDLAGIAVGQTVRIHSVQEGPDAEGKISYITPVVDQTTRTATARIVLPNKNHQWLPGMFVTGRAIDDRPASVAVPQSAIQRLGENTIVFVQTAGGFAPRIVVIGRQDETFPEILSGLSANERVATQNSFLLKAELTKSEAEEE